MRLKLREAREAAGLTQEQTAEKVGVHRTTYGQWERGEATPEPYQRQAIAAAFDISLSEVHAMLSSLPLVDGENPLGLSTALAVEQSATEIRAYEPILVYGLLQTADYAAAVVRSVGVTGTSDDYVQRTIAQREQRQRRVWSGDVRLHVVLTEAALRLCVGSPAVMAAQLRRVVELAELDTVTVQVTPAVRGLYEALRLGVSFSLQSHPWGRIPKLNLDIYGGIRLTDTAAEVRYFADAFDDAARLALAPAASVALLADTADQWEAQT